MSGTNPRNRKFLPACAKCGYPTRGIESLHCPECGSDLREVGIVLPGVIRSPFGGWLMPVFFTAAVIVLALMLAPAYKALMPRYIVQSIAVELSSSSGAHNATVRLEMIETASSRTWNAMSFMGGHSLTYTGHQQPPKTLDLPSISPQAEAAVIELAINPAASAAHSTGNWLMKIDPATLAFEASSPQGVVQQRGNQINQQAILDHMKRAGLDTSAAMVQTEADDLLVLVSGAAKKNHRFQFQSMGMHRMSEGWDAYDYSEIWNAFYSVAWFLFWGAVLFLLARRRSEAQMEKINPNKFLKIIKPTP